MDLADTILQRYGVGAPASEERAAEHAEAEISASAPPGALTGPAGRQAFLERYFQRSLGWLQIRQDSQSEGLLDRVGARAAAAGNRVFLGPGVDLGTRRGLGLLGHEVYHALRQRQGGPRVLALSGETGSVPAGQARAAGGLMGALKKTMASVVVAATLASTPPAIAAGGQEEGPLAGSAYGEYLSSGWPTPSSWPSLGGSSTGGPGAGGGLGLGSLGSGPNLNLGQYSAAAPSTQHAQTAFAGLGETAAGIDPTSFLQQGNAIAHTPTAGRTLFYDPSGMAYWESAAFTPDRVEVGARVRGSASSSHSVGELQGLAGAAQNGDPSGLFARDYGLNANGAVDLYLKTRYFDFGFSGLVGFSAQTHGIETIGDLWNTGESLAEGFDQTAGNAQGLADSASSDLTARFAALQQRGASLQAAAQQLQQAELGGYGTALGNLLSEIDALTSEGNQLSNSLGNQVGGASGVLSDVQGIADRLRDQRHDFAIEAAAGGVLQGHLTGRFPLVERDSGLLRRLTFSTTLKGIYVPDLPQADPIFGVDKALMAVRSDFQLAIEGTETIRQVLQDAQTMLQHVDSTREHATQLLNDINGILQQLPAGELTSLEGELTSLQAATQGAQADLAACNGDPLCVAGVLQNHPDLLANQQALLQTALELQQLVDQLGQIELPDLSALDGLQEDLDQLAADAEQLDLDLQKLQEELRIEADAKFTVVSPTSNLGAGLDLGLYAQLQAGRMPVHLFAEVQNAAGLLPGREDVFQLDIAGLQAGGDPQLERISSRQRNVYHDFFPRTYRAGLGTELPWLGTQLSLSAEMLEKYEPSTTLALRQPLGPFHFSLARTDNAVRDSVLQSVGFGYAGTSWGFDLKAFSNTTNVDGLTTGGIQADVKVYGSGHDRYRSNFVVTPTLTQDSDGRIHGGIQAVYGLQFALEDGASAPDALPAGFEGLLAQSTGQPLPPDVRGRMEGFFGGADFSGVRVHTGPRAEQAAAAVNAEAFALGRDVFFGRGYFDPRSARGQALIGHELTHVVQDQGGAPTQTPLATDAPVGEGGVRRRVAGALPRRKGLTLGGHDRYEREADANEQAIYQVATGGSAPRGPALLALGAAGAVRARTLRRSPASDGGEPAAAPIVVPSDPAVDDAAGIFRQLAAGAGTVADIGIGFVPVIGDVYDVVCGLVGRALFTWEQLDIYERLLCLAGVIPIPFVTGGLLRRGARALRWALSESKAVELFRKAVGPAILFVERGLVKLKRWYATSRFAKPLRAAASLPGRMADLASGILRKFETSKKGDSGAIAALEGAVARLETTIQKSGLDRVSTASYFEYAALRQQGYTAKDAHELIKRFRSGEAVEGFAWHFTDALGGAGITGGEALRRQGVASAGKLRAGKGAVGHGVYAGATPAPGGFQRRVVWGLGGERDVRIPIQMGPERQAFEAVYPTKTYVFEVAEDMPLAGGTAAVARQEGPLRRLWSRYWYALLLGAGALTAFGGLGAALFKRRGDPLAAADPDLLREWAALDDPEAVRSGQRARGGLPLEWSVRDRLERVLGRDLSDVRLHMGLRAEQLAQAADAEALTVGRDVFMGAGSYQPDTAEGLGTLVHEATHVVQEQQGRVPEQLGEGARRGLEAEAYAAERAFVARPAPRPAALPAAPEPVYRQEVAEDAPAPPPKLAVPTEVSRALAKAVDNRPKPRRADPIQRAVEQWGGGLSREEFLAACKDRLLDLIHDEVELDSERRETLAWNPYRPMA